MKGVSFSLDASHVQADVNRAKRVPGSEADVLADEERPSRAVQEYFDVLDQEAADGNDWRKEPPKAVSLTDPLAW